jgi:NADH:ubiquinone oxidoreductase subunit E
MDYDHEITICVGSSCFSRGNKQIVGAINDYLEKYQLQDRVWFHGAHCYGHCEKGPVMKVDGKLYEHINIDKVIAVLNDFFA